jgi:hypothetical protein
LTVDEFFARDINLTSHSQRLQQILPRHYFVKSVCSKRRFESGEYEPFPLLAIIGNFDCLPIIINTINRGDQEEQSSGSMPH